MGTLLYGANGLPINADTNGAAKASLYDTVGNPLVVSEGQSIVGKPDGIPMAGFNDNTWRVLRLDRFGSIRPGFDNLIFHDDVEGAAINTQLWTQSVGTFTQAQVQATGIIFNNANGLASGSFAILTSQKQFYKNQLGPLRLRMRNLVDNQTNAVAEFGFGAPVGVTAQIPTGAFWRSTSTGSMIPVIAYGGSDVNTGTDISASLVSSNYYTWGIYVDDDAVFFTCQNSSTGLIISEQTLQIPLAQPKMWSTTHLPLFTRLYTTAACASAPHIYLSDTIALALDIVTNKAWQHQVASATTGGAETNPISYVSTSNWTNSAASASATLSNTAAGYATLGGRFQFAAVAGAETDYALFACLIPSPYSFYCTGVHISAFNSGAAVTTTPTVLDWWIGPNNAAISLATAGMLRVPLGIQYFPLASPIGFCAAELDANFDTPMKTDAGRYFEIILRIPVGSATAAEIIRGNICIRGYNE